MVTVINNDTHPLSMMHIPCRHSKIARGLLRPLLLCFRCFAFGLALGPLISRPIQPLKRWCEVACLSVLSNAPRAEKENIHVRPPAGNPDTRSGLLKLRCLNFGCFGFDLSVGPARNISLCSCNTKARLAFGQRLTRSGILQRRSASFVSASRTSNPKLPTSLKIGW